MDVIDSTVVKTSIEECIGELSLNSELGIEIVDIGLGFCRIRVPDIAHIVRIWGRVHAGIVISFAEISGYLAFRSIVEHKELDKVALISVTSYSYVPCVEGEVFFEARALKGENGLLFTEILVTHQENDIGNIQINYSIPRNSELLEK